MRYLYTVYAGLAVCLANLLLPCSKANAQAEVTAWGNITALRIQGQPVFFEGSICTVSRDWKNVNATALERQSPKYNRSGQTQIIDTQLDSLYINEKVKGNDKGKAVIKINYESKADLETEGLFYRIDLDDALFPDPVLKSTDGKSYQLKQMLQNSGQFVKVETGAFVLTSGNEQLGVNNKQAQAVFVKQTRQHIQLYIPLKEGNLKSGERATAKVELQASAAIDTQPVMVAIDPAKQGRLFEGFGGNFRLQNPRTDPQVIDYCLDNMRVAWGRIEMPFAQWQPNIDADPIQEAKAENQNLHVQQSMEMAQRLQKMGIPIILTSWTAPNWAIIGQPHSRPKPGEQWGNPLNPETIKATYKGIADYIMYLKEAYGVDIKLFSFNESDLGINIRVTPQEHDQLIKGLGAYFVSRGLQTKMLLGDNSDANSYEFIYPALNDPEARPYIGAISFHSWRGWETSTLNKWYDAAQQSGLPLIVGEGSIDAAAWAYPKIFEEEAYARQEIGLYLRLLTICQPISILQWQLTADYSPLIGGGIFGNDDNLHPGQRFWNLKQFASVPKEMYYIPANTNAGNVTCTALGNTQTGQYALHFVNNGPTREVVVNGLPGSVKSLDFFMTDKKAAMKKVTIPVTSGTVRFTSKTLSFISLMTSESQ